MKQTTKTNNGSDQKSKTNDEFVLNQIHEITVPKNIQDDYKKWEEGFHGTTD